MTDPDIPHHLIMRGIGAVIGVIASMIIVAPAGTRNALYRALVGVSMGFIFAPIAPDLWGLGFLEGDELDLAMARGATMGFVIWWVLELIARLLSSSEWLERLIREMARVRTGGDK